MKKLIILGIVMLISAFSAAAANIVFWDNYSFSNGGTASDGIVWGGGLLDVSVANLPTGTKVVCWDWNGDSIYTYCASKTPADMSACTTAPGADASALKVICNGGGCNTDETDLTTTHAMFTYNHTYSESKDLRVKYYTSCSPTSVSVGYPTNNPVHYRILSWRYYNCTSQGGEYTDMIRSSWGLYYFNSSMKCNTGGCNISKAVNSSSFGTYGVIQPSAPCSAFCGDGICTDSERGYCKQDCPWLDINQNLITVDKPAACVGQRIVFSIPVKNIGAEGFGYVGLTTKRSGNNCFINSTNTPYLEKDQVQTLSINWSIPSSYAFSNYSLDVISWGNCSLLGCSKDGNGCYPSTCCKSWTRQDNATKQNLFKISGCPNISAIPTKLY